MIGDWSIAGVVEDIGGQLIGVDQVFTGVSTDTRTIKQGELFLALVGENFDGHKFIAKALELGAVAVCVSDASVIDSATQSAWLVDDTRIALGQLGALNRSRFDGHVIAVTGSAGKTTVKEMMAVMCGQLGPTLSTFGNLNNDLGAPMTLLKLTSEHQYAVIELGASGLGEIEYTVQLTKPHVAALNNALGAHLEGFGSLEGVVKAKGEIFDGLSSSGVAIINLDDYHAPVWLEQTQGLVTQVTFSVEQHGDATLFAHKLRLSATGSYTFDLVIDGESRAVSLSVLGKHNVANALSAMACLYASNLLTDEAIAALEGFGAVKGRMAQSRIQQGALLIDDSYNANPDAAKVAADVLNSFDGHRVFVLGDMAEIGADAQVKHEDVGAYIATLGVDALYGLGPLSCAAVSAFNQRALELGRLPLGQEFSDRDALAQYIDTNIQSDWTLLVKGSRSAKMDLVVTTLTQLKNEQ